MISLPRVLEKYHLPRLKWIQGEVISSLLGGRDTIGLLPTGTGKSLCFQVPGLVLERPTLVISPLLALMQDQVRGLVAAGVTSFAWNSLSSPASLRTLESQLLTGKIQILYLSPEKISQPNTYALLEKIPWGVLAVDEAHCITAWGESFRPHYRALGIHLENLRRKTNAVLFACTATATESTLLDLKTSLRIPHAHVIAAPNIRANLALAIVKPPSAAAARSLQFRLLQEWWLTGTGSALVYVAYRHTAVIQADRLQKAGLPAQAFHAGMEKAEKQKLITQFSSPRRNLFVSTCALGMGVDQPAVRLVLHSDSPTDLESYAQEVGRAGRDGQKAYAVWIYQPENLGSIAHQRIQLDLKRSDHLKKQVLKMQKLAETNMCINQNLLDTFHSTGVPDTCLWECSCNRCRTWTWRLWQA